MKRSRWLVVVPVVLLCFGLATSGLAQESGGSKPPLKTVPQSAQLLKSPVIGAAPAASQPGPSTRPGTLIIPKSSVPQQVAPGQKLASLTAHTNIQVYLPGGITPEEAPPFPGLGYETPASLACHYNLVSAGSGVAPACNPNVTTVNPSGGSQNIAIVDAFDDPNAPSDLAWFSLQFGIPLTASQFQVVWANTSGTSCFGGVVPPDFSGGWEVEESLDIEYAHAMAPAAHLFLVEACSNTFTDLFAAVTVATNLVQCGYSASGGGFNKCATVTQAGIVSMSWGGGEFSGETAFDPDFVQTNVEYIASAGDGPGTIYPCVSVNVICAGGTTIRRDNGTNGLPLFNFQQETAWVSGGGGISAFEPIPCFETGVSCSFADATITHCTGVSTTRCAPDVSFDADPYTGVYVYDTFGVDFISSFEWYIVGGTSVSAPSLAGIFDVAQTTSGFINSPGELSYIYSLRGTTDFTQISNGFCGPYMGSSVPNGWSFCTGIGVVNGYTGE